MYLMMRAGEGRLGGSVYSHRSTPGQLRERGGRRCVRIRSLIKNRPQTTVLVPTYGLRRYSRSFSN